MNDLIPAKFTGGEATLIEAKALIIEDEMGYTLADAMGKICKDEIKLREIYFKPLKGQADKLHKSLVAAEKESVKPWKEAKDALAATSLKYEKEQERIRAAAEKKLRDAAVAAEKIRQDKIDREREAAKEDPELTFEEPDELETFRPDDIVVHRTFIPKGRTTVTWHAEVVNEGDFYRGVITNGTWNLIQPNEKALEAKAKEMKGESKIPGLKFFTTKTKGY